MFAMERWCSLSRSISGGRGHKSLGRVGMAMGDPMGSNPNIYGFFSLFFTTGLMKWVFKISIEYGSGMGTRPFPHMLGFSFSISLSHSSEGNNLHRFCKGNDLAAAISVGVTTVVLQRELLALFCNWRNLSKRLTHQSAENTTLGYETVESYGIWKWSKVYNTMDTRSQILKKSWPFSFSLDRKAKKCDDGLSKLNDDGELLEMEKDLKKLSLLKLVRFSPKFLPHFSGQLGLLNLYNKLIKCMYRKVKCKIIYLFIK
ncbi:uncharacterized protein LOC114281515 isoform X1 [Camellia sinensis]|uniref:uncharacterized protein LOC114281515 isoform X1 n=1 Tax=Camellia sinensis TaxID=4442 RepID=UPI0010367BFA|nr:uncharacterized protein LOC114281515 isoform X1 [Camellia sinensis]